MIKILIFFIIWQSGHTSRMPTIGVALKYQCCDPTRKYKKGKDSSESQFTNLGSSETQ